MVDNTKRELLKVEQHSLRRNFVYTRPELAGCFSLDSHRNYSNDLSQLKYVNIDVSLLRDGGTRRVKFNLDEGRESVVYRPGENDELLDNLLKWILENKSRERNVGADVVCYRGLLTKLICTPYEKLNEWVLCATKFGGTIYLCEFETEKNRQKRENMTDREKKFTYWGHKFETYLCSDKPFGRPDTSAIVDTNEEFCIVVASKLNGRRLLLGAEVDGVLNSSSKIKSCKELAESRFVELKTNVQIQSVNQHNTFKRFKSMKWWSQSYLVGVEHLVCGFRDDKGIVHMLKQFDVLEIPMKAENMWEPAVCMNFLDTFLSFVDRVVKEEHPGTVWKFEWKPNQDVTGVRIEGPSPYSFMPVWFTEKYSLYG